ncbi:MAG TPA: hypothetical protein VNX28_13540 [Gemmataceae bacterium]|jgi:hypothetical protein|nr:hypothetical protein [Gemmataceae bacterium]
MPNGGPDCCGTCWFNSTHKGEVGYFDVPVGVEVRCTIRDLIIEIPFWTYCANHPFQASDPIDLPIGPVFVGAGGYPYQRKISVESPDTETIRDALLQFLNHMPKRRRARHSPSRFDEAVIDQLARFREARALPGLKRVLEFDPLDPPEHGYCGANRASTIGHALEAIAAITGNDALPDLLRGLEAGLQKAAQMENYDKFKDELAIIRYHAVVGLKYCYRESVKELLVRTTKDPNKHVVAVATELLQNEGNWKL